MMSVSKDTSEDIASFRITMPIKETYLNGVRMAKHSAQRGCLQRRTRDFDDGDVRTVREVGREPHQRGHRQHRYREDYHVGEHAVLEDGHGNHQRGHHRTVKTMDESTPRATTQLASAP